MANFKRYPIIGASKYEVTHDGKVFNKNSGKELSIRKDGRYKITNDDGNQVYITASVEYSRARFEDIRETTSKRKIKDSDGNVVDTKIYTVQNLYELSPMFPNYFMDRDANIFNKNNIEQPLAPMSNWVILYDLDGTARYYSRYKLFAIYALGQKDIGPVHVEDFYFMFKAWDATNMVSRPNDIHITKAKIEGYYHSDMGLYGNNVVGTYCGRDPLTQKRVKILPRKIEHFRNRLLEHYPYYVFVYEGVKNFYILHIESGYRVKSVGYGIDTLFHLPILKTEYDYNNKEYKHEAVIFKVPLNKLHMNPKFENFQQV